MKGWAITDYAATYTTTNVGEGRNASRIVTRTSASRTRVHPETREERKEVWNEATGWVAEEGEAA